MMKCFYPGGRGFFHNDSTYIHKAAGLSEWFDKSEYNAHQISTKSNTLVKDSGVQCSIRPKHQLRGEKTYRINATVQGRCSSSLQRLIILLTHLRWSLSFICIHKLKWSAQSPCRVSSSFCINRIKQLMCSSSGMPASAPNKTFFKTKGSNYWELKPAGCRVKGEPKQSRVETEKKGHIWPYMFFTPQRQASAPHS